MRIESVEIIRVELELATPLVTSQGTHDRRPIILVRVEADGSVGWGECDALAEPIYTDEDADAAEAALTGQLVPALLTGGREAPSAAAFFSRLDPIPGYPMARSAVEMALYDTELREQRRSFAELVGATESSIPAGGTVGIAPPEEAARRAAELVAAGVGRIKVKIAPGSEAELLDAVRRAIGFVPMSVDANGAYRAEEPGHLASLRALDGFGLSAIEQPFPATDLRAHAMLRRLIRTPIVLDESVATLGDLEQALEVGAADAVSIKPARLGGIAASLAICRRARAGGLELTIGGMLESGIGRAVAIALGAAPGFTMPGDLGPSSHYFARDLTEPHEIADGALKVPRGPGLGVAVDEQAVREHAAKSLVLWAS